MAQHQITVERPWANIPTKQLVNTETGQTEVFLPNPGSPFGDTKVAQAGANNQWEITDKNELLKRYNNKNSTNITEQELNKKFFTDGTKQFNNDRAAVINKNSPENTKTFLATKANPVPGTIDPKTGIKAGQTAPTTAVGVTTAIDGAAISKAVGVKEGTRNKFPGAAGEKPIVYPITLKNELQDVIKFSMIQYRPKTYSSDKFGYGERTRLSPTIEDGKVSGKDTQIIGTVVLPIPNGISDSNAVTWGGADSNAAQAAIGSVVSGSITNGVSGGADAIGNLVKTVYKNTPEVQAAITGLFVDNATQQQGFLARTAGLIINPNLELLFSAPTLRPFNFTFKLASRSPKESETIRSIIRFFKQGMSPIRSQSNLFLKAPHTFQIQYLHKGAEHKFLNKFKECALTNFSVSYTPEGQYATFNDGAMVSYSITMQFSELEPVFNDDYTALDQNEDTEIGF
jgi:hypothetical protein